MLTYPLPILHGPDDISAKLRTQETVAGVLLWRRSEVVLLGAVVYLLEWVAILAATSRSPSGRTPPCRSSWRGPSACRPAWRGLRRSPPPPASARVRRHARPASSAPISRKPARTEAAARAEAAQGLPTPRNSSVTMGCAGW